MSNRRNMLTLFRLLLFFVVVICERCFSKKVYFIPNDLWEYTIFGLAQILCKYLVFLYSHYFNKFLLFINEGKWKIWNKINLKKEENKEKEKSLTTSFSCFFFPNHLTNIYPHSLFSLLLFPTLPLPIELPSFMVAEHAERI